MTENGEETRAGVLLDGRYRLLRRLGEGGAALVWLADDLLDSQRVAIKMLHPHLRLLAEPRRRFAQEAELLAELAHPSIVQAKSFVLEGSRPYIAMEYREGVSMLQELDQRHAQRAYFSIREALIVLQELSDALLHAHQRGVVHRDLKPANVLLTRKDGELSACLLDFGLARLIGESDGTTVGRVVGTYRYMSPEQARGERVDEKSDIFGFALLAFHLLTLERPWADAVTMPAMLEAASSGPRPKPSAYRRVLSSEVDRVIAKATAADPAERTANVGEVYDALETALEPRWWASLPIGPFVAGAVGAGIIGAAISLTTPKAEPAKTPEPTIVIKVKNEIPRASLSTASASASAEKEEALVEEEEPPQIPLVAIAPGKKESRRKKSAPVLETPTDPPSTVPEPRAIDRQLHRAIAAAEAAPEDADRFRAASALIRANLPIAAGPELLNRWEPRDTRSTAARVVQIARLAMTSRVPNAAVSVRRGKLMNAFEREGY